MKVKIPTVELLALARKLIAALPGGISKEEAKSLGSDLIALGTRILESVLPEEIEVG